MNLQKVVNDLHGANEQTKVVALTILLKLPGEQLVSDGETFRKLGFLANDGSKKYQGQLGDLFGQFRDRLETLRRDHENKVTGDGEPDLSRLGRGDPAIQIATLGRIRIENFSQAVGEVRALLEVGAVDRVTAAAFTTLAVIGDRDTDLVRLRKNLGHPAGRVRSAAVQAVAAFSTPGEIVMTLGPALGDRHPHVRMNAIRALGKVGREEILQRLTELTSSESPEERARALPLLSYLRGDLVLEMVRRLAADPSDSVRLDVVNILRAHGGKSVASTLEWLAQDKHPRVRQHAARSMMLLKAGRGQRPGLDIAQLDSIPEEAPAMEMPSLLELDPAGQVQLLMRIKRQAPLSAYENVVALLEMDSLKPEVAASALSAVAVLGGREDISKIRPFLASRDGRVRANAVEAVDIMGGRKEILTWLTPLLADPIQRVKKNVLTALGRFGEAVFLGHLQRMCHSTHTPVRISGVYALAHYPGAAAKQLAIQVLQDKEADVRLNFAEALAGKSEAWTKEILGQMLKSDMDFRVREAAKTSLETQGASAAAPAQRVASSGIEMGAGASASPAATAEAPVAPPPASPPPTIVPTVPVDVTPAPATPLAAASAPPTVDEGPVYTMVDGLPMCPMPDEPAPSIRVSKGVQTQDGLEAGGAAGADLGYRPSVDIPRDLVLGAAKEAAAAKAKAQEEASGAADLPEMGAGAGGEVEPVAEGEAMVLEAMTANAQDAEGADSSQDALGRTFMNFAALISPGNRATMKEVQALEKDRSVVLEKMGRVVFEHIKSGSLKNSAFERTLYVLKKYLHNLKQGGKKDTEEKGWFGKMFAGGEEPETGPEEPPQLRAQYRNLAKDALELGKKGELDLEDFQPHARDIQNIDDKIAAVQAKAG